MIKHKTMHQSRKAAIITTVGATAAGWGFIALPATARAVDPTQQELLDRLRALETQVNQLKSDRNEQTASAQQAAAQAVAQDANARSQLLGGSDFNIHYQNGQLRIASDDGNFLLHPWLQLQFRNTTSFNSEFKKSGADDLENGFEVRRLKFGLDGHAFTPDLTYQFQFNVDRTTGNAFLEMAWAKYHFDGTPFYIRAGQFKDPFDHEQLSATRTLPAAERSLVDDTFANAEGFVQGVSLIYDPGKSVRGEVAFSDGMNSANTSFQDYPTNTTDWGAAGRLEYKFFGNWHDYDVVSAYAAHGSTLVAGVGADYTEIGHSDRLSHVIDAQYTDSSGLSIYGAYLGRLGIRTTSGNTYDATLRGQVSYAIDRHWEPYARYEFIGFDGSEFKAGTEHTVNVFTAGFNYYFAGPSARFTLDVSYLPDGSPVSDTGAGILTNASHDALIVRGQFQLVL